MDTPNLQRFKGVREDGSRIIRASSRRSSEGESEPYLINKWVLRSHAPIPRSGSSCHKGPVAAYHRGQQGAPCFSRPFYDGCGFSTQFEVDRAIRITKTGCQSANN